MGEGAKDGDPISLIIMIVQVFVLMLWLGTNSAGINPIAGNVSITTQYNSAFTNTEWLLWLLGPLAIYMIATQGFQLGTEHRDSKGRLGLSDGARLEPGMGMREDEG